MRIFEDIEEIDIGEKTVVAMGGFDGIHIGHREVIKKAKEIANKKRISLCIFTFCHPAAYYMDRKKFLGLLIDTEEKKRLIEGMGADLLVIVKFDERISSLSPDEFVRKILVEKLNCSTAVAGFNFKFGKDRTGDTDTLKRLGRHYGFEVEVVEPVRVNGSIVSSSEIRNALKEGAIENVYSMLGRYPSIQGTICDEGNLLFLKPDPDILIPSAGRYNISTIVNGKRYLGTMVINSIGDDRIRIELFGLDKPIRESSIRIEILEKEVRC